MKKAISLIFPHQLFEASPLLENNHVIYIIEEYLLFKQYKFHKQKIAFHRASMKAYAAYLEGLGKIVNYIDSDDVLSDIREFRQEILKNSITEIHVIHPEDNWLEKRIRKTCEGIR